MTVFEARVSQTHTLIWTMRGYCSHNFVQLMTIKPILFVGYVIIAHPLIIRTYMIAIRNNDGIFRFCCLQSLITCFESSPIFGIFFCYRFLSMLPSSIVSGFLYRSYFCTEATRLEKYTSITNQTKQKNPAFVLRNVFHLVKNRL